MDLNIQTHIGKPYKVNMRPNSDVNDLKIKIREILGLNLDEQKLLYMNQTLYDDNKKLIEYGVSDGSDVKLIITYHKKSFKISIEMQSGNCFDVDILSKDTLSILKRKIQGHCQLSPEEQILIYQGTVLEGDGVILNFGVQDKSVIHVLQRLVPVIQIFAKTMDGKTIEFGVTKSDRVIDVKKKIQEKIGLSPEEQKLVYQGGILEDDKTVEHYQIAEKSFINVLVQLRCYGMLIFAKTIYGKTVAFEVTKSYRVIDIKKKIQEKIGLSPEEQKLIYNGRMLEDDKTVEECDIAEKSVINVVGRLRNGMQIFVRITDGLTVGFEVTKSDRVIDIKEKIQLTIGLSPEDQILLYQGEILEDDSTVEELKMAEKSLIVIVSR